MRLLGELCVSSLLLLLVGRSDGDTAVLRALVDKQEGVSDLLKTNFASEPLADVSDFRKLVADHFRTKCDESGQCEPMLEISPFVSPGFGGRHCKYFDVLPREGLIQKAVDLNITYYLEKIDELPDYFEIDYIDPQGNLDIIDRKFFTIYSSNNLEHTVDLLKHLTQLSNLLDDGGKLFLVIPDKRVTFDHFRPLSTLSDIIATNLESPTVHSLRSVIEFDCESVDNVSIFEHMAGSHGQRNIMRHQSAAKKAEGKDKDEKETSFSNECVQDSIWRFVEADGAYLDIHRWVWTDQWFLELIDSLNKLDLLSLKIDMLYPTHERNSNIYVVMSNSGTSSK